MHGRGRFRQRWLVACALTHALALLASNTAFAQQARLRVVVHYGTVGDRPWITVDNVGEVQELGVRGRPQVTALARQFLGGRSERDDLEILGTITRLAAAGSGAVPYVARLLRSPDTPESVQVAAAQTLVAIGTPQATQSLFRSASRRVTSVWLAALDSVRRDQRTSSTALEALRWSLSQSDPFVRAKAAQKVGLLASGADSFVAELRALVSDTHPDVRTAALESLSILRPEDPEIGVLALSFARNLEAPSAREAAAAAFGHLRGANVQSALRTLGMLLDDNEGRVRCVAAHSLALHGAGGRPYLDILLRLYRGAGLPCQVTANWRRGSDEHYVHIRDVILAVGIPPAIEDRVLMATNISLGADIQGQGRYLEDYYGAEARDNLAHLALYSQHGTVVLRGVERIRANRAPQAARSRLQELTAECPPADSERPPDSPGTASERQKRLLCRSAREAIAALEENAE